MRAVCVDDELLAVKYTVKQCLQLPEIDDAEGFTDPQEALASLKARPADVVLLDINMPGMDGITLAKILEKEFPQTAVLFLTAYREYAYDAFSAHPAGYLLKPVSLQKLGEEISLIAARRRGGSGKRIQAHTFGHFELTVDGAPVQFSRSRAKELLAYLIDRNGAGVSRAAAFTVMFEDELYTRQRQKYMDVIVRSLRDSLEKYDIGELLQIQGGSMRIVPEKLDCDLYRYLDGEESAVRAYRGEYMSSYSWGVLREAEIERAQDNASGTQNMKERGRKE